MNIIIQISFILGSGTLDMVLNMVLGNVAFCGPVIAFILDNTIPGMKINKIILYTIFPPETPKLFTYHNIHEL